MAALATILAAALLLALAGQALAAPAQFLSGQTRARLILGPSGKPGATVAVRSLRVI